MTSLPTRAAWPGRDRRPRHGDAAAELRLRRILAGHRRLADAPEDERAIRSALDGAIAPVLSTGDDDTTREMVRALTAAAEARLRAVRSAQAASRLIDSHTAMLAAMADGLVTQDLDGSIVLCNAAAERALGMTADQMQGRSSLDPRWGALWGDGSPRPGPEHPPMLVLASGEPRRDDVMGITLPTGEVHWLLVNAVPIRDDAGVMTGVVSSFHDITERRAEDERRRAREAQLRAAQQLTGLASWELDARTGRASWSEQMLRLMGLGPDDDVSTIDDFLALMPLEDRGAARPVQNDHQANGHRDLFRVVRPDGAVRHLQAWTDPELDQHGELVRVLGATIDVTEREELLASLSASRADLYAAIELSRTATWELDLATGSLDWSDRMFALVGRDPELTTPLLADFMQLVHPDDRERIHGLGDETIATGVGHETTYRVVHADGSVHHIRVWTGVRRSGDGNVTHLWGTAMDITEQEVAAAQLSESEQHFRAAFDAAPIGMVMVGLGRDDEGRCLRVNAALGAMLGRPGDQLVSMDLGSMIHIEDRDRTTGQLSRLARGETRKVAFGARAVHADGSVVNVWLSSTVVFDAQRRPLYLMTHALDVSDRLRQQAELERLALTDTLTGLANRTLLGDRVDQALARLHRSGGAVGMLLLDIDRFKTVNDSLGHQVGDRLLVEVASRLEAVSRADATVARLGGDEFVVLVDGLPTPQIVHTVAERLLEAMRRPFDLGDGTPSLVATVSIGIAVATDASQTADDLYRDADLALYRAKDSGRDQYALYDDALRARAQVRMRAESLLRRALDDKLLVPVFQPIIDLGTGLICSAEALVRIQDGERLVLPADFIDVAEETGLIVEIDGHMFERVAAEGARLLAGGGPTRRLCTNVSARSLEDPRFVDRVARALTWYGVPGSMIQVELTERSLLTTSPTVHDSLGRIRELGLLVGLDDFGTGYSAMAYLQRFSLQFLKIDRSFVSRLGCSARDDAVVGAVIDLAHAHDLIVVGEGVETVRQLEGLRRLGCDRAQGYLMGKPMPSADLDALVATAPSW